MATFPSLQRYTKKEKSTSLETGAKEKTKPKRKETENMEYLIRLAQMHETFRRPELEALAVLYNVDLEILEYSDEVWQETFHFNLSCVMA
jgi:hypothetical protein